MTKIKLAFGIAVLLGMAGAPVQAGHGGHGCSSFSIGIGLGAPAYYRPWYPYYYPEYYYRPYPVYVAPAPVVVQPAPVIQQPVVISQAPTVVQSAPAAALEQAPPPRPLAGNLASVGQQASLDHHLQMLSNSDERVRADSVTQLGRLKSSRAVDPLAATLAGDSSPTVRETAARALGLIGSSQALPALQHAAQADSDRDVRRSAQFAAEVIQSRN